MAHKIYCLINDQEIVEFLARQMIKNRIKAHRPDWNHLKGYIKHCKDHRRRQRFEIFDFAEANKMMYRDLEFWIKEVKQMNKSYFRPLVNWLAKELSSRMTTSEVRNILQSMPRQGFVSMVGNTINPESTLISRRDLTTCPGPYLIRNIIHNEEILEDLMTNHKPFWFIDTGYTNFLTGRKTWHRLVENNIHHALLPNKNYWPANRLHTLPSMPRPWYRGGSTILVVENSERHYLAKGTTLDSWRARVKEELAKHTNRPVEFRPKDPNKKTRTTVWDLLKKESKKYYCVINDASSASIEAIWMGIPVITLGQHITNSVSRNSIEQINNLYYGDLGNWLCALTYSQWTYKDLVQGDAIKKIRKYHGS